MNGYFRCLLPYETIDVEAKVVTMRGVHTFRRDRTTQIIWCNPWRARFHLYSTLIKKMRTYLHLQGNLGPKHRPQTEVQPNTSAPAQPIANTAQIKEKRKTKIPAKRRYKVRLIAQPVCTTLASAPNTKVTMAPATLTETAPTPMTATTHMGTGLSHMQRGRKHQAEETPPPTTRQPVPPIL